MRNGAAEKEALVLSIREVRIETSVLTLATLTEEFQDVPHPLYENARMVFTFLKSCKT
jgi:hypothetical protein